jgi:hypothetical protein
MPRTLPQQLSTQAQASLYTLQQGVPSGPRRRRLGFRCCPLAVIRTAAASESPSLTRSRSRPGPEHTAGTKLGKIGKTDARQPVDQVGLSGADPVRASLKARTKSTASSHVIIVRTVSPVQGDPRPTARARAPSRGRLPYPPRQVAVQQPGASQP